MIRAPTTLHEHFRADPRGADSFGRWIEDRVVELLRMRATVEYFGDAQMWEPSLIHDAAWTVATCIIDCIDRVNAPANTRGFCGTRVVLLDGTIVREWSAP